MSQNINTLMISTTEEAANIKNRLISMLPRAHNISMKHAPENYIEMSIEPPADDEMKPYFAAVLTDCIIENYEDKIIQRIIAKKYDYLLKSEKNKLKEFAIKNLSDSLGLNRQSIVKSKLLEFLETSNQLVLEGFVNFRLREYYALLEEAVDESAKDFCMEQEYNEFIDLLRYFVDIQDEHIPHLHIVSRDNDCLFYDEKENDITKQCLDDFIYEVMNNNVNYDDLLISTLIVLSPLSITWHKSNAVTNKELIQTVTKIFEDKITFCGNCHLCE